jgi:L-asparagine transporter-like permease
MSSGLVWLSLIPLFGTVWQFIIVNKMADSLYAEFDKRQITDEEKRPGYIIGLVYCICFAISALGSIIVSIIHLQHWPDWQHAWFLRILFSAVGIIFWIIYWVKIYGYKSRLLHNRVD